MRSIDDILLCLRRDAGPDVQLDLDICQLLLWSSAGPCSRMRIYHGDPPTIGADLTNGMQAIGPPPALTASLDEVRKLHNHVCGNGRVFRLFQDAEGCQFYYRRRHWNGHSLERAWLGFIVSDLKDRIS